MANVDIRNSGNSSPKSLRPGTRASPVSIDDESSIVTKRRRLNSDDSVSSSTSGQSPRASPIPMMDDSAFTTPVKMMQGATRPLSLLSPSKTGDELLKYPKPETMRGYGRQESPLSKYLSLSPGTISPLTTPGGASTEDLTNLTFDTIDSSMNSSTLSTPMDSPHLIRSMIDFRKKYKKDELWASIQSDYQYLMDDEIIETCKSTESDFSLESDEGAIVNTVSFTEFLQQYNDLTDWLNQTQASLQRKGSSLSEKYLNQSYHKELQACTGRKKQFQDYGKRLMRRYPTMKEEIQARLLRVNTQWQELESVISPQHKYLDDQSVITDLEEDMSCLRKWLCTVEGELTMQNPSPDWSQQIIQDKINSHKVLQKDIESHSKIISSVLKVCERLQADSSSCTSATDRESVHQVAISLEKRWHNIWLQSLEWQCRLEEALSGKGFRSRRSLDDLEDFDLSIVDTSPIGTQTETYGSSSFGTDPIDISSDNRFSSKQRGTGLKSSGESDYDYYSDTSGNYDVIPFSENEYEKIPIDTDNPHTDYDEDYETNADEANNDGNCSPDYHSSIKQGTGSGCDDTDQGIDSALGRSYSDQSIGKNSNEGSSKSCPTVCHSSIKLCTDKLNQTSTKVIVAKHVIEMRAGDEARCKDAKNVGKGQSRDASDVGYSSESHHSNEELDIKLSGGIYTKNSGDHPLSLCEPNSTSSPLLGNANKSWRHSITSAYDTCSTGSDPNLHQPDDVDDDNLDLSESHNESSVTNNTSFHSIDSVDQAPETIRRDSSSQQYYCMTTIEGDIDPLSSCSIDPASTSYTGDQCESGNTSDLDSDYSRSLEIPFDEDPALSTLSNIEEEDMVNESDEKPRSFKRLHNWDRKRYDHDNLFPTDDDLSQDDLEHLTNAASMLLKYVEKRKPFRKSDSLSVQVDSEASSREQAISEDEINSNFTLSEGYDNGGVPSDAVRKLIQQAESLVADDDLLKLQHHKWPQYTEDPNDVKSSGKLHVRKKRGGGCDSLNTSTDGSHIPLRHSDCDASSEGDLSESCSEVHLLTSSDERGYSSAIQVSKNSPVRMKKSVSDYQVGDDEFGPVKLRNKRKNGERPHSVTELYERSSGLDLSPFSISEGAIYKMKKRPSSENISHRLGKAYSDQDKLPVKRLESPKKLSVSRRRRKSPPKKGMSHGNGKDRGSMSPVPTNSSACCRQQLDLNTASSNQDDSCVQLAGEEESGDDGRPSTSTQPHSTVEFEENAWDNYQAQPYSNLSSDCGEEKLDASVLQEDWDHTLEYDDEFTQQPSPYKDTVTLREKKTNNKNSTRVFDDSDSDLEDFQNVITVSQKALNFTDNTLRKPHKDPMDSGIYLDPSEYNESLATCRTQMKCLRVVVDTLQSEMGLTNVTHENIQQVLDIIDEWSVLEGVAAERLRQSQLLSGLYRDMVSTQTTLDDLQSSVHTTQYKTCGDIEQAIKSIQDKKSEMEEMEIKLSNVATNVTQFENNHSDINMTKFKSEVNNLQAYRNRLQKRCDERVRELQSDLICLYDFTEHHRDLQLSLNREQQQLSCLELASELVTFTPQEVKETVQDLKKLECEFPKYNGKLKLLKTLHRDMNSRCHSDTDAHLQEDIGLLDNQLADLKRRSESIGIKMHDKLQKIDNELVMSVASEDSNKSHSIYTVTASTSTDAIPGQQRSLLMRVIRATLPLNLLLLAVLILAYLFNPDMFDNFGLVFSPQLRYVRGPPPT